jgi:nucleoside-diphosphate-sugar epimerase
MKASGESLTEDDRFPENHPNPRMATEAAVDAVVARGVRAMAVRLPQVHGAGDHGFTHVLIGIAREKKFAAYVGEGRNHWPAVHRFDAAKVYRLAAEKGVAGARYHAIAEDGIAMKDLATVIARNLGVPVKSLTPDEAKSYFGWFAHFAGMDSHGSSAKTRAALGWQPTEIGLLEDMAAHYFANAKAA